MAKWIVVDVTVRVVLFSTIAFVVNFLDNFFSFPFFSTTSRGENLFFFFMYFYVIRKTATGFFHLSCYASDDDKNIERRLNENALFERMKIILLHRDDTFLFITCLNLDCFLQFYYMTSSH